jgi:hypothetical protein
MPRRVARPRAAPAASDETAISGARAAGPPNDPENGRTSFVEFLITLVLCQLEVRAGGSQLLVTVGSGRGGEPLKVGFGIHVALNYA